MGLYLDKVKLLAKKFNSIAITQTPRYDISHNDTLAHLTLDLEVDFPQTSIDIKESQNIDALITQMNSMYISTCLFTNSLSKAMFYVNKAVIRK